MFLQEAIAGGKKTQPFFLPFFFLLSCRDMLSRAERRPSAGFLWLGLSEAVASDDAGVRGVRVERTEEGTCGPLREVARQLLFLE